MDRRTNNRRLRGVALAAVLLTAIPSGFAGVCADGIPVSSNGWGNAWMREHATASFEGLGLFQVEKPSMTDLNPGNAIFNIPRYEPSIELRSKLGVEWQDEELAGNITPRYQLYKDYYTDGVTDGQSDSDGRLTVARYLVKKSFSSANLTFKAFRDNYQWGPAYLATLSNPFFTDNAQKFPLELPPGSDFLSTTWTPSQHWASSVYYNWNEGPDTPTDSGSEGKFFRTEAVKADYYFDTCSLSLIGAAKEGDRGMLGAFGQWTVNDATLLYFDSALRQGSSAYYPVVNSTNPTGGTLEQTLDDSLTIKPEILVGTSYTTMQNITLYFEYLYYSPALSESQQNDYNTIARKCAGVLADPDSPYKAQASEILGRAFYDGLRFERPNQIMFQITKDLGDFSLVNQNVFGLDDVSGYIYGSIIYTHTHHEFMLAGQRYFGNQDSQYRSQMNYIISLAYMFSI